MDSTLSPGRWWILIILASVCSLLLACTPEVPVSREAPAEVPLVPATQDQGPSKQITPIKKQRVERSPMTESEPSWLKYQPAADKGLAVRKKHIELFRRQPNVWSVGVGFLQDQNGDYTDEVGIVVRVTQLVLQEDLPEIDRIPESIDGVRIQILEVPNNVEFNVTANSPG